MEAAHGAVQYFQQQVSQGKLKVEEAQRLAKETLRNMRFGDNNYFWINDEQARVIMHAAKPELEGQDASQILDSNKKPIFLEFARVAQQQEAGGYVDYYWPKAGLSEPVFKVSYVKAVAGWGLGDRRRCLYRRCLGLLRATPDSGAIDPGALVTAAVRFLLVNCPKHHTSAAPHRAESIANCPRGR